MPAAHPHSSRNGRPPAGARGFTLIEVLVVIAILAVVVAVVTVTLGRDRGPARLRLAAERAQALITAHCRQNAILQGRLIGVVVDEHEYTFVSQFQDHWLPLNHVRSEALAPGVSVWVSLDGRRAEVEEAEQPQPQILCLPSGELTPFELHFELEQPVLALTVHGRGGGRIDLGEVRS